MTLTYKYSTKYLKDLLSANLPIALPPEAAYSTSISAKQLLGHASTLKNIQPQRRFGTAVALIEQHNIERGAQSQDPGFFSVVETILSYLPNGNSKCEPHNSRVESVFYQLNPERGRVKKHQLYLLQKQRMSDIDVFNVRFQDGQVVYENFEVKTLRNEKSLTKAMEQSQHWEATMHVQFGIPQERLCNYLYCPSPRRSNEYWLQYRSNDEWLPTTFSSRRASTSPPLAK